MSTNDARSGALLFDPMRLRIARQAALLKKKDLAERIDVSAAAISQYEKGQTKPSTRVVAALSLALGVPVGFFPVLDGPAFFEPFRPFVHPVAGRPSTPIETYLRLIFLEYRYKLGSSPGFESVSAPPRVFKHS